MGVSTKGCVATPCKDVFFVARALERALNKLIRDNSGGTTRFGVPLDRAQARLCKTELLADSQGVDVRFCHRGEERTLTVYFSCDADNEALAPASLSLILGCHGESALLMQTALQGLSMLGPVYYDYSDADDSGKTPLEVEPLTFLTAAAQKLASPTQADLAVWFRHWQQGYLRQGCAKEVLGLSEEEIETLLALPYEDARMRIQGLVGKTEQPTPPKAV